MLVFGSRPNRITRREMSTAPPAPARVPAHRAQTHPALGLHRTIGNQAALRLLRATFQGSRTAPPQSEANPGNLSGPGSAVIQPKLTVNSPGDAYEQEAGRVADQVMRMPEPGIRSTPAAAFVASLSVQRKCACGGTCADCRSDHHDEEHAQVQMKAAVPGDAGGIEAPAIVHEVLRSPGQPLDAATRRFMEPRFGQDFSGVRVHTDSRAIDSAKAVRARAYTLGGNIVFGSGQFSPATAPGQQLLAHELAHVVQQGQATVASVQRSPDLLSECTTCHQPMAPLAPWGGPTTRVESEDDKDPLYFGPTPMVCQNCHQKAEQSHFPTHVQSGGKRVTYENIIDWTLEQALELALKDKARDRLFSALQRHEDQQVQAMLAQPLADVIMVVASASLDKRNIFSGSNRARSRFAGYLNANHDELLQTLNQRAVDRLVLEIKAAIRTYYCPGSSFVKDPQTVRAIEDNPQKEGVTVPISFTTDVWKPGLEIGAIRVRSAGGSYLAYEVLGHEGIYFETTAGLMNKHGCVVGLAVRESVRGGVFFDEIWKGVSKFTKGLLTAVASPVEALIEAAAQVIDLASQSIAAFGKWRGWYDIGYTCISSACKKAEACLDSGKSVHECQTIGLTEAVESASVVIPLFEQGRACLEGDMEACGSIAPMFVGLVPKGPRLRTLADIERAEKTGKPPSKGKPALAAAESTRALTAAEFEDAAIREAIGRRRVGDPHIAEAFERPKAPEKRASTPRKPVTEKDVVMDRAVHEAAQKAGSELKLDEETHAVAAYGKGEDAGIRFCSEPYCSLVREKVGAILNDMPKDYDVAMMSDLRHLYVRIAPIETALKAGRISEEVANRFSHQVANELESYAKRDRNIRNLLKKTTEELRARRSQITKELEGKPLTEPAPKPRTEPGTRGTAGTRAARTYHIYPETALARSQRGYQVYEYRNAKGELLYVGKSGGAGGKGPMNWSDRLKNEHIQTEWIGEARTVNVLSGLTEQEAFALEEDLIAQKPKPKYNKKGGEYSSRFPQGDRAANAQSASRHGARDRFSLEVMF